MRPKRLRPPEPWELSGCWRVFVWLVAFTMIPAAIWAFWIGSRGEEVKGSSQFVGIIFAFFGLVAAVILIKDFLERRN